MGNRAVITTPKKELAVYLHWNGGRDSVEPLLRYCELQGYCPPSEDNYGWARMAQVMGNFFGSSANVGIDLYKYLGDQGDNGVYVIDGWRIVDRFSEEHDAAGNVTERPYPPECEQCEYDPVKVMLALNEAMPENLRLDPAVIEAERGEQHA